MRTLILGAAMFALGMAWARGKAAEAPAPGSPAAIAEAKAEARRAIRELRADLGITAPPPAAR